MEAFNPLITFALYGLMAGILGTAIFSVTTRNMFHAAIFLAFTLLGVAGVYFFLHADFIAAAQILLYVGAIMVLVIYAIMLTARIQDPKIKQSNNQRIPAFVLVVATAVFLITAILKTPWRLAAEPQTVEAAELGKALVTNYIFPFEIVAIVLLVALIGAIAVARSD